MIWLVLYFFVSVVNCNDTYQNDDKLIFTHVIFRHGDRAARFPFPNDLYKDKSDWPEGWGQLTNLGKQQSYDLGLFFRRRYNKLLGTYSPDKVIAVASDFDRTVNTASVVLAALFPPTDDQIWNVNLLWQPIPVHRIPLEIDYLIAATDACPRFLQLREEYESSPEIKSMVEQHRELLEYLEKHSGQPIRSLIDVRDIWDTLNNQFQRNKTLPEWTNNLLYGGEFERLAFYWPFIETGTTELKRLKTGFLLKEILERSKNKTLSLLPDQLIHMYSGHELTISTLLNSLGLFELHTPDYASSLLLELYETSHGHYIQLFYKHSATDDLILFEIPGCGRKCTIDQLNALFTDILPLDETECQLLQESGAISLLKSDFQFLSLIITICLILFSKFQYF